MFATNGGIHLFEFFDHYAIGINLFLFLLFSTLILAWQVDYGEIIKRLEIQTGESAPFGFGYLLKYLAPVFIISVLVIGIIYEVQNPKGYDPLVQAIGWLFLTFPFIVGGISYISIGNRMRKSIKSDI